MGNEPQPSQQNHTQAPQRQEGESAPWVGVLILVALGIYVVILGFITVDQWFDLEYFPKELEKRALVQLAKFKSTDEVEFAEAQKELLNIEDFVTVPMLIRRLKSDSPVVRRRAYDTLKKISEGLQSATEAPLFDPDAAVAERKAAVAQWKDWAKVNRTKL